MTLFDCHSHRTDFTEGSIFNADLIVPKKGWFSAGLHPWNTHSFFDDTQLKVLLKHPRCLALGEIGLDRVKGPDFSIQTERFVQQLFINQEFNLPVILHEVRSFEDIVASKMDFSNQKWVLHGFQKIKNLDRALEKGFYLSIGGAILNNEKLSEAIKQIPKDKILIESDTHVSLLPEIYSCIAKALNLEIILLQQIIEGNFKNLFTKWNNGLSEPNFL